MKTYITEEERLLFRNEMKKFTAVQPEETRLLEPEREKPSLPSFSTSGVVPLYEPEESVVYRANGVREKELKRFGRLQVEMSLDLHGCTLADAKEELRDFLTKAYLKKAQLLRIIHGKNKKAGSAVLKSRVVSWLKQIPWILAFRSARQQDGGAGALYVLLKKNPA